VVAAAASAAAAVIVAKETSVSATVESSASSVEARRLVATPLLLTSGGSPPPYRPENCRGGVGAGAAADASDLLGGGNARGRDGCGVGTAIIILPFKIEKNSKKMMKSLSLQSS